MNLTGFSLRNPFTIIALVLVVAALVEMVAALR